ncbi:glycosyltransferase family 2 protein [bacterium]|nr:MAG: glycosyltransferase family 2 protein [bacterium]
MPMVSVIMSQYNGGLFLQGAVESILAQTYSDFEFIILDDASTDGSLGVLKEYAGLDKRIKLIENPENQGLTKNLNCGIRAAEGKYIARIDADDVAHPERFARQLELLENNRSIDVCGSWIRRMGDRAGTGKHPVDDRRIKANLFLSSSLFHPTVMMRKSFLDSRDISYAEEFKKAQDYDLWVRMAEAGAVFHNIPEALVFYRFHPGSVTSKSGGEQASFADRVRFRQLARLIGEPSGEEKALHLTLVHASRRQESLTDAGTMRKLASWVRRLAESNDASRLYDPDCFRALLSRRWDRAMRESVAGGLGFKDVWDVGTAGTIGFPFWRGLRLRFLSLKR